MNTDQLDENKHPDDTNADQTGSETRAANTGGVIPNDAASYDPDYDPGAAEPSAELAEEFAENGPGMQRSSGRFDR